MKRISFYQQIKKNKRSSVILILSTLIILFGLITIIALAVSEEYFFTVIIFGTIFSIVYILISLFESSQIILKSVNAIEATPEEYKEYHNLVEGMCLASGMPKPKLYVMKDNQINAFATGNKPEESIVCVTTGALKKLNKQELEGVIAHEMSHIANYDIRFMSLVAVIVGLISIISQIFLRSSWRSSSKNSDNGNAQIIFFLLAIVLAILSPLLVTIVQLSISRKREYMADASAVKFVRSPTGLILALEKIKSDTSEDKISVPDAVAPLFLTKPTKTHELFQTHPPIEKRIEILKRM
jgi:heat shock protein HtpX